MAHSSPYLLRDTEALVVGEWALMLKGVEKPDALITTFSSPGLGSRAV